MEYRSIPQVRLPVSRIILGCACAAMLVSEMFALHISTILLLLIAGFVSFTVYMVRQSSRKEAGK